MNPESIALPAIALPASTGQLASPQDPPVPPLTSAGFTAAHSHTRESKLAQQVLSSTVRLLGGLLPSVVHRGLLYLHSVGLTSVTRHQNSYTSLTLGEYVFGQ